MSSSEKMCKMFLGGLNRCTTDDCLRDYFSKWGTVIDFVVIRDGEKNSRGFGFVTLANANEVDAVLGEKPHTIDGKEVEVKRAIPRDENSKTAHEKTNKVFIGGLARNVTEQDVNEFFARPEFNVTVEKIELILDKETKEFRGFGFMTLATDDMADKLSTMRMFETPFGDKKWEVKKATKRDGNAPGGGGRGGGGRGGGGRGRGRGAPRGGSSYGGNYNTGFGGGDGYNSGGYGNAGGYNAGGFGGGNNFATGGYDNYGGNYQQSAYGGGGYDYGAGAAAAAPTGYAGYDASAGGYAGGNGGGYESYGQTSNYGQMQSNYGPSRGGRGARYKPY